jgi:hypothetical protein
MLVTFVTDLTEIKELATQMRKEKNLSTPAARHAPAPAAKAGKVK